MVEVDIYCCFIVVFIIVERGELRVPLFVFLYLVLLSFLSELIRVSSVQMRWSCCLMWCVAIGTCILPTPTPSPSSTPYHL